MQTHKPESVVFVVDTDDDGDVDGTKFSSRMHALHNSIGLFVTAKARVNPLHRFGLAAIQGGTVQWCLPGLTTSPTVMVNAIRQLIPSQAAARPQQSPSPSPPSSPDTDLSPWSGPTMPEPLDIGVLHGLVDPLKGILEFDGLTVRIILIYCRSSVKPVWISRRDQGLVMDVLYLHDKAQPGFSLPQEVFDALEDLGDAMGRLVGHKPYIFECKAPLGRRMIQQMMMMLSTPSQRKLQHQLKLNLVDLALPSAQQGGGNAALQTPPAWQSPHNDVQIMQGEEQQQQRTQQQQVPMPKQHVYNNIS